MVDEVGNKPGGAPSNEEVLGWLADGRVEALRILSDRFGQVIAAVALRILGDNADAEEVATDVIWQAWRQGANFDRRGGSVAACLITSARSFALDRLRARSIHQGGPRKAIESAAEPASDPEAYPAAEAGACEQVEHREIADLLPLAALDRLEFTEKRALDEHLALGCHICAAELSAYREAATAVALAEPREDTGERIWRKVKQRLEPMPAVSQDPVPHRFDSSSPTLAGRGSTRRTGNAGLWRAIAGMSLAVMIATVMVAIEFTRNLAGEVAYHGRIADELARRNDWLKRQLALSQRKLLIAQTAESEARAHLSRIFLSGDAKALRLGPPPTRLGINTPNARGLVTISAEAEGAAVQVSGLPQLAPGRVYELWWIGAKGGPMRAGLIRPGPHGDATMTTTLPPAGDELTASAVTIELDGGVPKPTGPTVLKGLLNETKPSRSLASRLAD